MFSPHYSSLIQTKLSKLISSTVPKDCFGRDSHLSGCMCLYNGMVQEVQGSSASLLWIQGRLWECRELQKPVWKANMKQGAIFG